MSIKQKSSFYHYIRIFFALILTTVIVKNAEAEDSATIVQPIGTLVQEWDPSVVNVYLEKWDSNIIPGVTDPFDRRYAVSEVQPTKAMYFVRVYTEPNSGPLGSYIVRASVIRGMTPQQIRNILALPDLPTKIDYVKVPAGAQYGLWTGIAGRIMSPGHEWGEGGGEQTKIIGKETNSNPPADPARFADYSRLPADSYMNARFIGNNALSYSQSVSNGNAGKVATYLDGLLPQPYSDMESVYTTLDYINADGPPELAVALNQISPINFDTYSTVLFRNDLLFNNTLFQHTPTGNENLKPVLSNESTSQKNRKCFASWVNAAGEQGEQSEGTNRVGMSYQTTAFTGGADCEMSSNLNVGFGAGYYRDHLGWNMSGGSADMNNAKAGIYSSFFKSDYFFNSSLTGGLNWSSAQRKMNFSGDGFAVLSGLVVDTLSVDRTATSNQNGQNLGFYFIGGKNILFNEWTLMPTAQMSYFYSGQNAFVESGADDLNLNVNDFNAQTIRTQLALSLSRKFSTKQGSIIKAYLQLGWAHNFFLDKRIITASLPALGGSFSVNGFCDQSNEALANAGLSIKMTKKVWIDAQYNADLSHGFNSQALSFVLKYYLE